MPYTVAREGRTYDLSSGIAEGKGGEGMGGETGEREEREGREREGAGGADVGSSLSPGSTLLRPRSRRTQL